MVDVKRSTKRVQLGQVGRNGMAGSNQSIVTFDVKPGRCSHRFKYNIFQGSSDCPWTPKGSLICRGGARRGGGHIHSQSQQGSCGHHMSYGSDADIPLRPHGVMTFLNCHLVYIFLGAQRIL
jgi:hypothetical protein